MDNLIVWLLSISVICLSVGSILTTNDIRSNRTSIQAQTRVVESQSRVILDLVARVNNLDRTQLKPTDEMTDDLSVIKESSKGKKDGR
jgi:hypothetical protein